MHKAILIIAIALFATTANAQEQLQKAFEQEDASLLSSHFDDRVDMLVMNKDNNYSREEAIQLMESFFKVHAVHSFKKMHSGASRGQGSNYQIHHLDTDKGAYRVYIYYNSDSGSKRINELRIETN